MNSAESYRKGTSTNPVKALYRSFEDPEISMMDSKSIEEAETLNQNLIKSGLDTKTVTKVIRKTSL